MYNEMWIGSELFLKAQEVDKDFIHGLVEILGFWNISLKY